MQSKCYRKISLKKKQRRKRKTLKINKKKSRKLRYGGSRTPISTSHSIGKSVLITIQPSKLDNSKYTSNIRVSGYQNNIDETLSLMVKSLSNINKVEKPIYSRKIAINTKKVEKSISLKKTDKKEIPTERTISNIYNVIDEYHPQLPINEFKNAFEPVKNDGNGNCLFFSLSHELKKIKITVEHSEIRKNVATTYKNINNNSINPVTNTILDEIDIERMQRLLESDVESDNSIENDGVYGELKDVLTVSIIYNVTINIYTINRKDKNVYDIIRLVKKKNNKEINILYLDENHYMALDKK